MGLGDGWRYDYEDDWMIDERNANPRETLDRIKNIKHRILKAKQEKASEDHIHKILKTPKTENSQTTY